MPNGLIVNEDEVVLTVSISPQRARMGQERKKSHKSKSCLERPDLWTAAFSSPRQGGVGLGS